ACFVPPGTVAGSAAVPGGRFWRAIAAPCQTAALDEMSIFGRRFFQRIVWCTIQGRSLNLCVTRQLMPSAILDREEYIEQAYFFRVFRERLDENVPAQEILAT